MNQVTTPNDTTPADARSANLQAMIDGYFECWNTTDATQRSAAIERVWAPHARSVDPLYDVTGHDELAAMFAGFHDEYPGSSFRQHGVLDTHHDRVRWGWAMHDAAGDIVLDGLDVVTVDSDGRIEQLVGFFGVGLPAN
jgi:hypothetical protein